MSSDNPTGFLGTGYFQTKNLRNLVNITDTLDDVPLETFGGIATTDITGLLFPYSALLPLDGDLLTMAQNAASYKVASLWKASKNNIELANFYNTQFKNTMDELTKLLKSTRNIRTKKVQVNKHYHIHRTYAQQRKF